MAVFIKFLPILIFLSPQKITRIDIEGAKYLKKSQIIQAMGLREGMEWKLPLYKSGLFRLKDYYRRKGFFNFKVIDDTVVVENSTVLLRIKLDEGTRKIIGRIVILGQEAIDSQRVYNIYGLRPPVPYDEDLMAQGERKLLSHYENIGYPYVEFSKELSDTKRETLAITYKVIEGPRVIISKVRIEGRESVRKKIIEREISIKKNSVFSSSKIFESIRRIYSTGLFSSVRHTINPLNATGDTVEIVFKVKESPPRYALLGIGYRSPLDMEGKLGFGHRNLFNNNQIMELSSEILTDLSVLKRRKIDLDYREPYLLGFRLEGRGHLYYYHDTRELRKEYGFDFEVSKYLSPYFRVLNAIGWKKVLESVGIGTGVINLYYIQLLYDSRDNIFDPTGGYFISLRTGQAGWILGGDYDFRRFFIDFSEYRSIRLFTVAYRFRTGSEWGYRRTPLVPSSEWFTLGGEGSLRGVDEKSIGPFWINPQEGIKGGNALVNLNLEIRKKLNYRWGIVLFLDAGQVLDQLKHFSFEEFVWGWGIGIRFFLPFGPVRLDWGRKLLDVSTTDRGRVYVAIGHMF